MKVEIPLEGVLKSAMKRLAESNWDYCTFLLDYQFLAHCLHKAIKEAYPESEPQIRFLPDAVGVMLRAEKSVLRGGADEVTKG